MEKYIVRACPNCLHYNKKTHICGKSRNDTLETWFSEYGRLPQREWNSDMDVGCYEDSKKIAQTKENKENIKNFMTELGDFLKKQEEK